MGYVAHGSYRRRHAEQPGGDVRPRTALNTTQREGFMRRRVQPTPPHHRRCAVTLRTTMVPAVALFAAACAGSIGPPGDAPAPLTELPRSLSVAEQTVRGAANGFTFSLFRRLNEAQRGSNVFVSPLSASMALGMTMNGADGATLDQMRGALGF